MSFPKRGKVFPPISGGPKHPGAGYAAIVSEALRADLGDTHRAVKTLTEWTGANDRSAKNWLAGTAGPNGDHLIVLLRKSETLLSALLAAAERHEILAAVVDPNARGAATKPHSQIVAPRTMGASDHYRNLQSETDNEGSVHRDVTTNVTINVPGNVTINSSRGAALNERQDWFLANLAQGANIKTGDMQLRWGVAERTAKRDIADLKKRGLIGFFGARKKGDYRLTRR